MGKVTCYDCGEIVGRIWQKDGKWHTADENGKKAGWAGSYLSETHAASEVRVAHGRANDHGRCRR